MSRFLFIPVQFPWKFFLFLPLCLGLGIVPSWGDILYLKDGASLHCKVLEENEPSETGARYIQIEVNKTQVWVKREFVQRVEKTPDSGAESMGLQDLLNKLIEEGKIVPSLKEQLTSSTAIKTVAADVPFIAKQIQGWAYLYKDEAAIAKRERTPLEEGQTIPSAEILRLSPNTHVTLGIGEVGEIGLDSLSEVQFEDVVMDPSTQSYRININLIKGAMWIIIDTPRTSWKRVIFSINRVRSVLQTATLHAEATGKLGEVNITYIEGKNELNFWRGNDGPFYVPVNQVLRVIPNSSKLAAEPSSQLTQIQAWIRNWKTWQPEEIAVDFQAHIPPLQTFPTFGALPVLFPYEIPVDQTMAFPPQTLSLGEILAAYKTAMEKYKYDTGKYPDPKQGLEALFTPFNVNGWRGPYLDPGIPRKDLWGEEFVYTLYSEKNKQIPDIRSKGPNKKDDRGLGDDVR